jgi:hypothetical protein
MSLSTMKSCLHSLFQEAAAYEIPREELFDIAGLYVPTVVSQSAMLITYLNYCSVTFFMVGREI